MWNGDIRERILYEDGEILVCHKSAGMAVQSARMGAMDLESALKNYLAAKEPGKVPYLAVIHRLDQPVEGVLVFAKTPSAAAALNRQLTAGKMEKLYLAVTDGAPAKEEDTLEDYLKKDARTNTSFVTTAGTPNAKKARLSYKVIGRNENKETHTDSVLLEIRLYTGRHHQIRVQLSHAGMPLLGDQKYHSGYAGALALCAYRLAFVHPKTGKSMHFRVIPEGEAFFPFVHNAKDLLKE